MFVQIPNMNKYDLAYIPCVLSIQDSDRSPHIVTKEVILPTKHKTCVLSAEHATSSYFTVRIFLSFPALPQKTSS